MKPPSPAQPTKVNQDPPVIALKIRFFNQFKLHSVKMLRIVGSNYKPFPKEVVYSLCYTHIMSTSHPSSRWLPNRPRLSAPVGTPAPPPPRQPAGRPGTAHGSRPRPGDEITGRSMGISWGFPPSTGDRYVSWKMPSTGLGYVNDNKNHGKRSDLDGFVLRFKTINLLGMSWECMRWMFWDLASGNIARI